MKNRVITILLAVAILILGFGFTKIKTEQMIFQKEADQSFTTAYTQLVLNMLNMTIDGVGENAIHRYETENTKYGHTLVSLCKYTSFHSNQLSYIVSVLDQASGYDAVYPVYMTKELYDTLKLVPNDRFRNESILEDAKEALNSAFSAKK